MVLVHSIYCFEDLKTCNPIFLRSHQAVYSNCYQIAFSWLWNTPVFIITVMVTAIL